MTFDGSCDSLRALLRINDEGEARSKAFRGERPSRPTTVVRSILHGAKGAVRQARRDTHSDSELSDAGVEAGLANLPLRGPKCTWRQKTEWMDQKLTGDL
jgi:hypothetical protein